MMGDHEATNATPWWAVQRDAVNRAWRTLYTGFILDALVLIGGGIGNLLLEKEVTSEAFWIALAILVTKSLMTSLGSYLLRLKVRPSTATPGPPAGSAQAQR